MKTKTIRLSEQIIQKYRCLMNSRKAHIIITSGRAGTKSSFAAIKAIKRIVSSKPASVVILRKHGVKLRRTVYTECLRAMNRLGFTPQKKYFDIKKSPMQITCKQTGNTIFFSGSDSADATKGLIDESRPISLVIIDEVTEFFERPDGYDEVANIVATFVRGNDDLFQTMYLYNPPKNPYHPVVAWTQLMEKRSDCIHVHTDYRDVPAQWLGSKLIEEAKAMEAVDSKMYRWTWLGESIGLDDVIYYMFKDGKHIREKPEKLAVSFYVIGVDYGQMNATAFEAFAVDAGKQEMQGLAEYYYSGRDEGKQKSPSDYAKDMRQFLSDLYAEYGKRAAYVLIDPSAKGLKEEIRRMCPDVILKDAKNDVKLGISRVQKGFSYGRIYLSPKQTNLIDEIRVYSYDPKSIEKGREEPMKVFDHACVSAYTEIATEDGAKPIYELVGKSGFKVWTINETTEKPELKEVEAVQMTRSHADVYQIEIDPKTSITCTADHLIWTASGWSDLSCFHKGKAVRLVHKDGTIEVRKPRHILPAGAQEVFNMRVKDNHNFMLANGIVCHNCDALRYGTMEAWQWIGRGTGHE